MTFPVGASTRGLLDRHFPGVPIVMELSGISAVIAFVKAGTGIALVSRGAVEAELAAGRLIEIPTKVTPLPRSAPGRLNYAVALHKDGLSRLGTDGKWRMMTDVDPDGRIAKVEVHAGGVTAEDPRVEQRRLREAEAAYRRTLELDPRYGLAMIHYGALLVDLGQTKPAIELLLRATKVAPRSAAAFTHLGVAYAQAGDGKRARKALETAIALDPKAAEPWWDLAVLAADGKKPVDALAAWEQAIQRDGARSPWGKAAIARRDALKK